MYDQIPLPIIVQAMERRYTALAEDQGKVAAEREKLLAENSKLKEVSCNVPSVPSTAGFLYFLEFAREHCCVLLRSFKQHKQRTAGCKLLSLRRMPSYRGKMSRYAAVDHGIVTEAACMAPLASLDCLVKHSSCVCRLRLYTPTSALLQNCWNSVRLSLTMPTTDTGSPW